MSSYRKIHFSRDYKRLLLRLFRLCDFVWRKMKKLKIINYLEVAHDTLAFSLPYKEVAHDALAFSLPYKEVAHDALAFSNGT